MYYDEAQHSTTLVYSKLYKINECIYQKLPQPCKFKNDVHERMKCPSYGRVISNQLLHGFLLLCWVAITGYIAVSLLPIHLINATLNSFLQHGFLEVRHLDLQVSSLHISSQQLELVVVVVEEDEEDL